MDKVISQTQYNRKQHKEFYLFHLTRRSGTIKLLAFIVIVMLIIAIANTFDSGFKIKEDTSSMMFSWIMFAVSLSFTPFLIISRVNNVVKQETPERLKSTEKIEVTKMKFTRSNDCIGGKSVFGWTDIQMICETEKYFYVYLQEDNGIFIVKEDIIEGDVELFKKMAMANLKKNKKGRPLYKRYGKVRREYRALMKLEKQNKKLGK